MSKTFYCEACGAEVKSRADSCPSCGRSFLGIRCPRCGKEGSADDFIKGCPDCGFMTEVKLSGDGTGIHGKYDWPARNRRKPRAPWPVSRYLVLSGLVIIAVLLILYWWLI